MPTAWLSATASSAIQRVSPISGARLVTPDPFLFAVYHKDFYPAGNDNMEAPRRGNGNDRDPAEPYRMYHGDRVPGFPQHPHRGFETITATLQGVIDHTDSLGNAGRFGQGDVNWMTAGRGIVHGEMFPLVSATGRNTLEFFQIWLNLPAKNKMSDPRFVMHWAEEVPTLLVPANPAGASPTSALSRSGIGSSCESGAPSAKIRVWAGEWRDDSALVSGLQPPPASWANEGDVAIFGIELPRGASVTIPAACSGAAVKTGAGAKKNSLNRSLYFVGGGADAIEIDGQLISQRSRVEVDPEMPVVLHNSANSSDVAGELYCPTERQKYDPAKGRGELSESALVLVLQGRAIGEPVAQHGPFVMNTQGEILKAIADYQDTQFGGWPWEEDAVIFPREKGRFGLQGGEELLPPGSSSAAGE